MDVSREDLKTRFHDLSDDELLDRARRGDLTDLAREVMAAELAARGLTSSGKEAPPSTAPEAPVGPLTVCTRFLNPVDAEIFAARLMEEGIAASVMDSDTLYANGLLFGSLALGGVRVMVPESMLPRAQAVLASFNAGEYALDEDFDPNPP